MWNDLKTKIERNLVAYLNGPRKSVTMGVITLPPLVLFYVQSAKSNFDIGTQVAAGLIVLTFMGLLSLVTFENTKWRSVPISILISMGFGFIIVNTLARVTENTPDQVLQASQHLMALCGLYGFCAAIMGVMIHGAFKKKDANLG